MPHTPKLPYEHMRLNDPNLFHVEQKYFLQIHNNVKNIPLICISMSIFRKILSTSLMLTAMTLCVLPVHAKRKRPNRRHNITIGFQSGQDAFLNPSPSLQNRQTKTQYGVDHGLTIRKKLSPHFKIESGISYNQLPNPTTKDYSSNTNFNNCLKPYCLSLPTTLQYYFLPQKSKLRPYCGAGIQYNINISPNTISPFSGDSYPAHSQQNYQSGTKYISILFTQGVTYKINTKIQITQSFHFIPSAIKTFGLDLGLGFTIP